MASRKSTSANESLLRWLPRLRRLTIGVLGDFAADHYLVGKTARISREAPVLILKKQEDTVRPGQAGNSAANLAALGVRCLAFGAVGPDAHGRNLVRALAGRGIDTSGIITARKARTLVKTRVLAGAHHTTLQQVIRLDDDEGLVIGSGERRRLSEMLAAAMPRLDALLVSDYGYGTADVAMWDGAEGMALRVLDSRHALASFKRADVITPNETEVFAQLGMESFNGTDPVKAGRRLMDATECRGLVMTRGNEGMIVFDGPARPESIPILGTDEVTDVTGAGDTVSAVVTAARAAGASLIEAARLANAAAGIKVMKRGAAVVSPEEIRAVLTAGGS